MQHRSNRRASVITVMTSRDAKTILDLLNATPGSLLAPMDEKSLLHELDAGVAFFVAYAEAMPVGVLGYRWQASAMRIVHVAVKETHQHRGIASRLLQAVETVAQGLGTRDVTLEVPGAIQPLFESCGYAPAGKALRTERPLWVKTLVES